MIVTSIEVVRTSKLPWKSSKTHYIPYKNLVNKSSFIFSPLKSKSVKFNYNLDTIQKLHLKNTRIPFQNSLRIILVLIFDSKLNWTTHLKQLKVTWKAKLNIIKTLAHHTWGADKTSLINIYETLILSQINYGSIIYNTANTRHLKTLDSIHHGGIRLSIGAFRTSPTESIRCYAGEISLQLLRDKNTLLHCIKRKTTPNHIGHIALFKNQNSNTNRNVTKKLKTIQDIYSNLCNKMNIYTSVEEKIIFQKAPSWLWNLKLSTDLLTLFKHEINYKLIISHFYEIIHFHFLNHTQIYTDASKSEHGVVSSVIHNQTTIQHKLCNTWSNKTSKLITNKYFFDNQRLPQRNNCT